MDARLPKDPNVLDEPWLRRLPQVHGWRVLGSIVLLERLGAGAMGIVLRGWHIEHGREVAVKVLNPMLAVDAVYVGRFRREAKLAMRITHHNVVRVFDVRCDANLHYIVMEYVPGESLRDRIERAGAMTVAQATSMFAGIAAGLAEAHALGIVHRDIKPDNVMVSTSGRAKLADLGLARQVVDESGATLVGQTALVMGTPQYMSPEQWETPDVKPPCDVWALGATFYFAVTGQAAVPIGAPGPVARWIHENELPELSASTLSASTGSLPTELVAIHARCVHRESSRRYRDAGELYRDLAALSTADESCLVEAGGGAPGAAAAAVLPGANERLRLRAWLLQTREARRLRDGPRTRRGAAAPRPLRRVPMQVAAAASLMLAILLAVFAAEQRGASAAIPIASVVVDRPLSEAAEAMARGHGSAALLSLAEAAARRRLRLMYPDHQNLQNRRAGLLRAIARAEREVGRQRDSWLRHDDKQRLMTQRSAAADRGSNGAYWRQQAVRHDQRKEVHARAMRAKQGDIERYREEIAAIERATLRMRGFSLPARSSAPGGR